MTSRSQIWAQIQEAQQAAIHCELNLLTVLTMIQVSKVAQRFDLEKSRKIPSEEQQPGALVLIPLGNQNTAVFYSESTSNEMEEKLIVVVNGFQIVWYNINELPGHEWKKKNQRMKINYYLVLVSW